MEQEADFSGLGQNSFCEVLKLQNMTKKTPPPGSSGSSVSK